MKKNRLLLALVLVALSLVSVAAFSACRHTCVFDQEYQEPEYLASAYACVDNVQYYKSCTCGESSQGHADEATFTGTPKAHNFNKEVVADKYLKTAATCTSKGVYYKSCICGASSNDESKVFNTDKIDHDYQEVAVIYDKTKPYCEGHDYVTVCTMCFDQDMSVETTHKDAFCDDWHVVTEPTHTTEGLLAGICIECNRRAEKVLKTLDKSNKGFYNVTAHDTCDVADPSVEYSINVDGISFHFVDEDPAVEHLIGEKPIFTDEFDEKTKVLLYNDYPGIILHEGRKVPTCAVAGESAHFVCSRCENYMGVKTRVEHKTPAFKDYLVTDRNNLGERIEFHCLDCNDENAFKYLKHNFVYNLKPEEEGVYDSFKLECICLNELNDKNHLEEAFVCDYINEDASEHNLKVEPAGKVKYVEATCTTPGYYEYVKDGVSYKYSVGTTSNTHVYRYNGTDYKLDPDGLYHTSKCPGIKMFGGQDDIFPCDQTTGRRAWFECALCSNNYEVRVYVDHTKPEGFVKPEPKCVEVADVGYTCTVCHEMQHEYVDPEGHGYTHEITAYPTYETVGKVVLTCKKCNHTEELILPVLSLEPAEKDYSIKVIQEVSCDKIGIYEYTYVHSYKVTIDSEEYPFEYPFTFKATHEPIAHDFEGDVVTIKIKVNGKEIPKEGRYCKRCGKIVILDD